MTKDRLFEILDDLTNKMVEDTDANTVIRTLIDHCDCTYSELIDMGFNEDDVYEAEYGSTSM